MMNRVLLVLLAVALAVCLSGCGGGGSKLPETQDPIATLRVVGTDGQLTNTAYVAFQDGDGAWVKVSPTTTGKYSHAVTSGRYGFLVLEDESLSPATPVVYYSGIDLPITTHYCGVTRARGRVADEVILSGDIQHSPIGASVDVSYGPTSITVAPPATDYSLNVTDGAVQDLIAAASKPEVDFAPSKLWLQRNLTVNGNTTQHIDFTDSNAFAPETPTVTITGNYQYADVMYFSAGGSSFLAGGSYEGAPAFSFAGLPLDRRVSGDCYSLKISNADAGSNFEREVIVSTPADSTIDLSDIVPFSMPTSAGNVVSWQAYPSAQLYQLTAFCLDVEWTIYMTATWLNGATSYTVPTLTAMPGSGWTGTEEAPSPLLTAYTSNRTCGELITGLMTQRYPNGMIWTKITATDAATFTRAAPPRPTPRVRRLR